MLVKPALQNAQPSVQVTSLARTIPALGFVSNPRKVPLKLKESRQRSIQSIQMQRAQRAANLIRVRTIVLAALALQAAQVIARSIGHAKKIPARDFATISEKVRLKKSATVSNPREVRLTMQRENHQKEPR